MKNIAQLISEVLDELSVLVLLAEGSQSPEMAVRLTTLALKVSGIGLLLNLSQEEKRLQQQFMEVLAEKVATIKRGDL